MAVQSRWSTAAAKRSSSTSSKRTPPRTTSRAGSQPAIQQPPKPTSPVTTKATPRAPQYRYSQSLSARPSLQNTLPGRKSGYVPREARVVTERLSDFADFMRSTAPSDASQATPYTISPRPSSSTSSTPKKPTGPRMEARSANARASGADDLIDFIRRGPPSSEIGEHRIPRNVAPFRTTMDSDDFNDLPGSAATNGAAQNGIMTPTSAPPQGMPVSRVTQPAYSSSAPSLQHSSFVSPVASPMDGPPARKQRRVKDPYALDSDDEEDLLTALPINGPRRGDTGREESLAEFLRATEPPRELRSGPPAPSAGKSTAPAVRSPGAAQPSSAGRAPPSKRLEARAAGRTTNFGEASASTFDMADFLRSSGPPSDPVAARKAEQQPPQKRASAGQQSSGGAKLSRSTSTGRKFWQRKTVEGT